MTPPRRISARATLGALATVGALLLAGCSSSADAHWQGSAGPSGAPVSAGASTGSSPSVPAALTIAPAANAANVAPAVGVKVIAAGGVQVTGVTVTAGSKTVAGSLSSDGTTWQATGKLDFGTKYTVKVDATNVPAGTPTTTTFTTASASRLVSPTMWANAEVHTVANGSSFGVGEPVIVGFDRSIPTSARAAVVKALKVTSDPAVEGRWHWIDNYRVDYRPEKYWATGTTITLKANLYGVKIGTGTYGGASFTKTIKIGESHVAIADAKTHMMKVYINGKLAKTIPVSLGQNKRLGGGVDLNTRNGPHVVLYKTPWTIMSSGSYGLTDKNSPLYYAPEKVYLTVKISGTGEYVHLRTWTTGDLGVRNTSHGCINVGPGNAQYMYNLLVPGDVVDVVNSPTPLPLTDGIGDWLVPWDKW